MTLMDFAEKYHANRIETDWKKAISLDTVDIVIICTYPSTHLEILRECIKCGKHVLCEKPIAQNMEEGEEIVRLVKENPNTKVLIGYILRHNKTYMRVAQMIQSGAIGKPIVMRMAQNHHTMDWEKYLHLICETSPILDCGVHYIDEKRWFTGAELTEVSGKIADNEDFSGSFDIVRDYAMDLMMSKGIENPLKESYLPFYETVRDTISSVISSCRARGITSNSKIGAELSEILAGQLDAFEIEVPAYYIPIAGVCAAVEFNTDEYIENGITLVDVVIFLGFNEADIPEEWLK